MWNSYPGILSWLWEGAQYWSVALAHGEFPLVSGYPVNESIMTIINFNFATCTHLILQDYGCLQKQSIHGKQNSGLVKFVSESRFPWIGIRHLANNNGCEGLKTGIKDGSELLWIAIWNIPSRKTRLPFQIILFHCCKKRPKKLCSNTFHPKTL